MKYFIIIKNKIKHIIMGNETINAWVLPSEAIEWVNKNIPENSIILELGSGFGTKLLSKLFNMVSIEHNQEWINKYKSKYIYAPLKNGFYDRDIIKGKLTDEYILILDDDMFTNKYAVEIMMNNVKEDKVLIWKVDFKKLGIKPNESFNKTVQLFDIGAIGFCYHISQIKHTDWSEWKRGDYRTAKKLEENIGIIWLDEILTGIQDKLGMGIKPDIIN